ncbi:MAG: immunogenic 75 kDa protein PG4 [Chlorobi bacterium OLB7]|nr:MAG: immunogenic 75 kDa protein PG4 [Chlorobi bacterium OLB7]
MRRSSFLFLPLFSMPLWFLLFSATYAQPDTANFRIRNASVLNSDEDDYAPFVTPNGRWLYFTTSRTGKAKLYRSKWEMGEWGVPEPVPSEGVNTDVDDGVLSVPLPALTQLYQLDDEAMSQLNVPTIGIMASGKRDKPDDADLIDSDIYLFDISHDGLAISNVRPIPAVNTRRWESQPTIAPDGSFIIFSGDTSNGDDHKDLYISERRSDGSFGPPRNMGPQVNSQDREVSPFLAPDGRTLFFASDRSGGFGGADFYVTQRNARGEWSTPENLGSLINTSANELFFYGASRAYCLFVSDRDGGHGGFDLYEAAPNIFAPGYTMVQLTIMDTVANRTVSGNVKVTEARLGKQIASDRAEGERGIRKELPSGIGYRFEVTADGYPGTRRAEIPMLPADTTINLTVNVGKPAPPPPPTAAANCLQYRRGQRAVVRQRILPDEHDRGAGRFTPTPTRRRSERANLHCRCGSGSSGLQPIQENVRTGGGNFGGFCEPLHQRIFSDILESEKAGRNSGDHRAWICGPAANFGELHGGSRHLPEPRWHARDDHCNRRGTGQREAGGIARLLRRQLP